MGILECYFCCFEGIEMWFTDLSRDKWLRAVWLKKVTYRFKSQYSGMKLLSPSGPLCPASARPPHGGRFASLPAGRRLIL